MTDQQRQRLLEAYRTDPEPGSHASYRRAAEAAGVDPRTARRAFKVGWPGVKPIRDIVEVEKTLARAALRREALAQRMDEASRLAQEDAVQARADEGRSVRAVTSAAASALLALHAEQVHLYERALAKMLQDENPGSPKARAARRAYADIANIIRTLAEASERGQRMGRLLLGEPSVVLGGEVGIRPVTPVTADPAVLAEAVAAAQRALDELRQLEAKEAGHGSGGVAA